MLILTLRLKRKTTLKGTGLAYVGMGLTLFGLVLIVLWLGESQDSLQPVSRWITDVSVFLKPFWEFVGIHFSFEVIG